MSSKSHGENIQSMFDRISPRYDLLNRLLSFGRDIVWRKRAVKLLGNLRGKNALDLCCGTGDFLKILSHKFNNKIHLYGADFSCRMLNLAQRRFSYFKSSPLLCRADALELPFGDSTFSAVTIGFGIRNIVERRAALEEISRIMEPGGKLVIVEPAFPRNIFIRIPFVIYFKYIMPLIGGLISGDKSAYRYLDSSASAFPPPLEFTELMKASGFEKVRALPQSFEIAMIYFGKKADE